VPALSLPRWPVGCGCRLVGRRVGGVPPLVGARCAFPALDSSTMVWRRARHRGQYVIASQEALGVTVSRQRGHRRTDSSPAPQTPDAPARMHRALQRHAMARGVACLWGRGHPWGWRRSLVGVSVVVCLDLNRRMNGPRLPMNEPPWCMNAPLRGSIRAGWSSWPGGSVSEPAANATTRSPTAGSRACVTTGLCARRQGARASGARIAGFCDGPAWATDPGAARVTVLSPATARAREHRRLSHAARPRFGGAGRQRQRASYYKCIEGA
jgi:hypothetical protein